MVKLTTFFDVYKQMESEGLEVDTNYAKSENSKKLLHYIRRSKLFVLLRLQMARSIQDSLSVHWDV